MKRFLGNTVDWLERLKANASKCHYTIFSGIGSRNVTINLDKIPYVQNPALNHETLKEINNAIISSLFVYSFFSAARIALPNLERLQRDLIYLISSSTS